jgi:hypothetical protein
MSLLSHPLRTYSAMALWRHPGAPKANETDDVRRFARLTSGGPERPVIPGNSAVIVFGVILALIGSAIPGFRRASELAGQQPAW